MNLSTLGVYSFRGSTTDIIIMFVAAVFGYFIKKVQIPAAPIILGLLLGGTAEQSLRQALTISQGSLGIFVSSPIATGCLLVAFLSLALSFFTLRGKAVALRNEEGEG